MFIFLFLKRHLITILHKTDLTPPPTLPPHPPATSCPPWQRYIKAKAPGEVRSPWLWAGDSRWTHSTPCRVNRKASPSCSLSHPASQSRLSQPCWWIGLCPPHLQDKGQKETLTFQSPKAKSKTAGPLEATVIHSIGRMTNLKLFSPTQQWKRDSDYLHFFLPPLSPLPLWPSF